MTLYVLRVERRTESVRVEPFSRRIRLAAYAPAWRDEDGKRRSMAAARAA